MAKPSFMDWFLDPKGSEEDYQEIRNNKKTREAAAAARQVLGSRGTPGQAAMNLTDLAIFQDQDVDQTPVMTEAIQAQDATGMMSRSSPEMQDQLTTLQELIDSGNPAMQSFAMTQLDEMVKPPADRAPDKGPTSLQEYRASVKTPTKAGYAEFLVQDARNKNAANYDSTMPDPALAKQFQYTGSKKPLTNETPSQIKQLVKNGDIEYRPDAKQVDLERAGLGIHTAMDTINVLMDKIKPQLKGIPEGLSPIQSALARGQRWIGGAIDINLNQGVMKQYASQAPLIAKLFSRNVFQDKGAGSDKDAYLAQDFLPVLPGQNMDDIGDDPEVMELKLEAINYIVNTLYPRDMDEFDSYNSKIKDPTGFSAQVKRYHDELMALQGKEADDDGPPPGTTFSMPDPATGEMVEMITTADGRAIRVGGQGVK